MKGWKASSFEVPYVLSKASNLAGSRFVKHASAYPNQLLTTIFLQSRQEQGCLGSQA